MRFTFGLAILTLVYFVFGNSRTPLSPHRTKRELYNFFVEKHIIFLEKDHPIKYSFLREKLLADEKDRHLHTFIIVLGENDNKDSEKMMALQKRLDDVISKKIRENECGKRPQKKLIVKKNTCLNIKKKIMKYKTKNGVKRFFFDLSNYFICKVKMDELNVVKLYLLNFNPMNDTDTCEYSKKGSFILGAGEIKGKNKTKKNNRWFVVNHLEGTELTGIKMNCIKK